MSFGEIPSFDFSESIAPLTVHVTSLVRAEIDSSLILLDANHKIEWTYIVDTK